MKNFVSSVLLLIGLVAATACKKSDSSSDPAPPIIGNLGGNQQVPMVTTTARGTITGTFDKVSSRLKYSVSFTGLSPIGAHFHFGMPGVNGPIIIELPKNNAAKNGYVSPIEGENTFNSGQASALLNHGVYVNLHTLLYHDGEIRADMTVN